MACMCGDTECPSCGLAQGTLEDSGVLPNFGRALAALVQMSGELRAIKAERAALRAALADLLEQCYGPPGIDTSRARALLDGSRPPSRAEDAMLNKALFASAKRVDPEASK